MHTLLNLYVCNTVRRETPGLRSSELCETRNWLITDVLTYILTDLQVTMLIWLIHLSVLHNVKLKPGRWTSWDPQRILRIPWHQHSAENNVKLKPGRWVSSEPQRSWRIPRLHGSPANNVKLKPGRRVSSEPQRIWRIPRLHGSPANNVWVNCKASWTVKTLRRETKKTGQLYIVHRLYINASWKL